MKENKLTILVHPTTGKERKVKKGFSWTVGLFGVIALLIRRQFKMAAVWLGVIVGTIILVDILIFEVMLGTYIPHNLNTAIGVGISVGFGTIANDYLLKQLLKQGYQVQNAGDDNLQGEIFEENQN